MELANEFTSHYVGLAHARFISIVILAKNIAFHLNI
jgi:hypothetical protein